MKIPGCVFVRKWHLALASAAIYFHLVGVVRITSFLFVGIIERFGVDRSIASLPFVLRTGISQIIGPIVGYIGCKFRINRLILLGCFLASFGMALCFFAENIYIVIVCWGVVAGFAHGLVNLVTVIVNSNYRNDGSAANGISLTGSSLGAIVYTLICEPLIDEYKIGGTFLIISAISLNSIPAAMLLTDSKSSSKVSNSKTGFERESVKRNQNVGALQRKETSEKSIERTKERLDNNEIYKCDTSDSTVSISVKDQIRTSKSTFVETTCNEKLGPYDCILSLKSSSQEQDISTHILKKQNTQDFKNDLQSLKLEEFSSDHIKLNQTENSTDEIPHRLGNKPEEFSIMNRKNITSTPSPICQQERNIWKIIPVFYDPIFIFITFAQSSFLALVLLASTTMGDYTIDKGFTLKEATIVIGFGAFGDMIGRFSLGWVTDRGLMSLSNFMATLYLVAGSTIFGIVLCSEMFGLTITFFVGSYVLGALQPLFPTMISQNFDGDMKTIALMSRFLLFVPISFIISPSIGYFRENLGSYDGLYCSMGVFCGMCAILFLLMPNIQKCRIMKANV